MRIRAAAWAALAVAVVALTGCTDSAAPSSNAASDGDGELRQVRVAALPIADTGAIWGAAQAGVFAEHGFEVEIVTSQGGAQAVPALLSGDVDFSVGQPFGSMRAEVQGLGVVIVGNFSDSYPEGDDIVVLVAPAGSEISSTADLAGKRIGTNSIGSAGDVTTMRAVDEAGEDPSTVEFVEVIMPDAQAQLEAGNIDAAILTDPFASAVVADGGSVVLAPYQEAIPGISTQVLTTRTDLLEEEPEFVSGFTEAMNAALIWADGNDDLVRASLVDNMGVSAETAEGLSHSDFSSELSQEDLEALAQIAVDYGVFERLPDFDRLIQVP